MRIIHQNEEQNEEELNGEATENGDATNGNGNGNGTTEEVNGIEKQIANLQQQFFNFELIEKTNAENRSCTGKFQKTLN